MKALSTLVIALVSSVSSVVFAADAVVVDIPRDVAPPASPVTRGEVLADLHMWQLAGMPRFARNDQLEEQTDAYRLAVARYQALRQSAEYAQLAERLQGRPLTLVVGR